MWPDTCAVIQKRVRSTHHLLSVTLTETRVSTSYDRYYEGRKDFGTMVSHVRLPPSNPPRPLLTPL